MIFSRGCRAASSSTRAKNDRSVFFSVLGGRQPKSGCTRGHPSSATFLVGFRGARARFLFYLQTLARCQWRYQQRSEMHNSGASLSKHSAWLADSLPEGETDRQKNLLLFLSTFLRSSLVLLLLWVGSRTRGSTSIDVVGNRPE